MNTKSDDSVMFAIRELQQLEADRVADETNRLRAAEAERAAREKERARKEREAAEHAARAAEAEARLRVEAERRQRDDELASRMSSLRSELDAVQADRLRLQERFAAARSPERTPSTGRGWAVAFGVASAVAAGLAAILVMRSPAEPVASAAPVAAAVVTPTVSPSVIEPSRLATVPAVVESQPAVGPESAGDAPSGTRARARADRRRAQREPVAPPQADRPSRDQRDRRLLELERCGDDPTCGM